MPGFEEPHAVDADEPVVAGQQDETGQRIVRYDKIADQPRIDCSGEIGPLRVLAQVVRDGPVSVLP